MYELPNNDPLVRSRPFNPTTGSELTLGAVQKLAAATADLRAADGSILAKVAKFEAAFNAAIADLERRIDHVETETKARIVDAAAGETLAERLARLNQRR
jgi:hypothetical protein